MGSVKHSISSSDTSKQEASKKLRTGILEKKHSLSV
jgi:hypothetical protein